MVLCAHIFKEVSGGRYLGFPVFADFWEIYLKIIFLRLAVNARNTDPHFQQNRRLDCNYTQEGTNKVNTEAKVN